MRLSPDSPNPAIAVKAGLQGGLLGGGCGVLVGNRFAGCNLLPAAIFYSAPMALWIKRRMA